MLSGVREYLLHHASRQTRYLMTGDDRSWCAHAFENRHHPFWGAWTRVWGWSHCRDSYLHYEGK